MQHRHRNVAANLAVIGSGAAVWLKGSFWPDLIVTILLTSVFLHTSYEVLRDSARAWATHADQSSPTHPAG